MTFTEGHPAYVQRADAERCLTIVQNWIERTEGPGWTAALYVDHEGPYWNISLEGADDWAVRIGHDESVSWPEGVYVEALYSWAVALYPVLPPPGRHDHVGMCDGQCGAGDAL